MIKLWRKRYFRLYADARPGGLLAYFKDNKVTVDSGHIPLKGTLSVDSTEVGKFSFSITMKTSARVWHLRADSEEKRTEWIEAIGQFVKDADAGDLVTAAATEGNFCGQLPPVQFHQPKEVRMANEHRDPATINVAAHALTPGDVHLYVRGNKDCWVHEVRSVAVDAGTKHAVVENLPKTIKPNTLCAVLLGDAATGYVSESRYYNNPSHTTEELLERLSGEEVEVTCARTGGEHLAEALATEKFKGKVIYKPGDSTYALLQESKVHMLKVQDLVTFAPTSGKFPSGLFRGPAFVWTLSNIEAAEVQAEMAYSAPRSIQWSAHYNAILSPKEDYLDVNAYVRVENTSDRIFENAKVILASDPSAVPPPAPSTDAEEDSTVEEVAVDAAKDAGKGFFARFTGGVAMPSVAKLKSLGKGDSGPKDVERVYPLVEPVTLYPNGAFSRPTHVALAAGRVPCKSYYLVRFDTPKFQVLPNMDEKAGKKATGSVQRVVEFVNAAGSDHTFGQRALPAGNIALKRREPNMFGARAVGAAAVPHIDVGDVVTVPFDTVDCVSVTRTVTGFNFDADKHIAVETVEISVVNGSEYPIKLRVEEAAFRWETWEVTVSEPAFAPHPDHSRKAVWDLELEPLGGKEDIKFTMFYQRFPLPSDGDEEEDAEEAQV